MLQRHILYVAKTKFICCKDKIYMSQRQNVYVAKTKFICYRDKCIGYKEMYMLSRQNVYVIKTRFICSKDKNLYVVNTKKHGARAERARRGFFSPKKRHSYFLITQYSCFVLEKDKIPLKSTVLGLSAPAGAFFSQKETFLFFGRTI